MNIILPTHLEPLESGPSGDWEKIPGSSKWKWYKVHFSDNADSHTYAVFYPEEKEYGIWTIGPEYGQRELNPQDLEGMTAMMVLGMLRTLHPQN